MLRLSSLMHSVALLCALAAWGAPSGRAVTASGRYGFPYRPPESPILDSFTFSRVPSFPTFGCLRVLYAFTFGPSDPPTFGRSFGSGMTYEHFSERQFIAITRYGDFVDRLGGHQLQHACCHDQPPHVNWQQAVMHEFSAHSGDWIETTGTHCNQSSRPRARCHSSGTRRRRHRSIPSTQKYSRWTTSWTKSPQSLR